MNDLLVHCHIHNFEHFHEIANCIRNITIPFDMYVTLSDIGQVRIRQKDIILANFPNSFIYLVENKGADTVPFLRVLQILKTKNHLHNYKYLFKIHSKDNPYWRVVLINAIAQDKDTFNKALNLLKTNNVGMVGAAIWVRHENQHYWESSGAIELASLANINIPDQIMFIGGTIFLSKFEPIMNWSEKVDLIDIINNKHQMHHPGYPKFCQLAYIIERLLGLLITSSKLEISGL